jgi:hypothetical protein
MVCALGKADRLYEETRSSQWQTGVIGLGRGRSAFAGQRLRRSGAK